MNCKETDNSIRLYSQNGAIDTANTNAVSFVNGGSSIANLNGFPINPGQCISFGNEKDQCDKTKYQVAFINTGLQTNALYVFRGNSGIQFSQIIAAIGGTHDNVNIFDSAGSTLTASGGKLTVLDAAVVSAINALATSGLATSANQATEISILNSLPTSGLSTSALQTALNNSVATKVNQNTEIALITNIDTYGVKTFNVDKVPSNISTYGRYVASGNTYASINSLIAGLTISTTQIGILTYWNTLLGNIQVSTPSFAQILYSTGDFGASSLIATVTNSRSVYIDSWVYNNCNIYIGLNDKICISIVNKSDLYL